MRVIYAGEFHGINPIDPDGGRSPRGVEQLLAEVYKLHQFPGDRAWRPVENPGGLAEDTVVHLPEDMPRKVK